MTHCRQPLVIANWKMNGSGTTNNNLLDELLPRLNSLTGVKIALCPPFPYLSSVATRLKSSTIAIGAQNVSEYEAGAYTGEVSASMLKDLGCQYSLVGHSERRTLFKERDHEITNKVDALLSTGITPVLCVGETLVERRLENTIDVVLYQIKTVLDQVSIEKFSKIIIAYEPIWAIGTGETASPEQAEEVHSAIRSYLNQQHSEIAQTVPIIYGGSVSSSNAAALFSQPNIDGGLVGGASLKAIEFTEICQKAIEKP